MRNAYLIGRTVYLRPLERSDAPQLEAWINDPEVSRSLMPRGPMNLQAEEAFVDHITRSPTDLVLGIMVRESERFIGTLGLMAINTQSRHAGCGLVIGDKGEWGKGYASAAFGLLIRHAFLSMNLNRLWLHVYEFNKAALRVYQKLGFRQEGVLRQHHFGDGRYHDTITMGILRDEWQPDADG